jgi:hypothetical protein
MLDEAASICHLLGGMAARHLIVVGGLVPPLLVPGRAALHVGSADIDFCLSLAITDGQTSVYKSIEETISPFFESVGASGFRWRKRSGQQGIPLLLDFLAPNEDATPISDGTLEPSNTTTEANLGAALRPFPIRTGKLIDRDAETVTRKGVPLTHRPGVRADVRLKVAGPVGFLAAKADALDGRDDPKDGYDVAWWCLNAASSAEEAAKIVIGRPAFADELFPESVHQINAAFSERDYPGPSGYASETHPDLRAGDDDYERARNEAFARVAAVAELLREKLWR